MNKLLTAAEMIQRIEATTRKVMLESDMPNPCEMHGAYPDGYICQKCQAIAIFSISAQIGQAPMEMGGVKSESDR